MALPVLMRMQVAVVLKGGGIVLVRGRRERVVLVLFDSRVGRGRRLARGFGVGVQAPRRGGLPDVAIALCEGAVLGVSGGREQAGVGVTMRVVASSSRQSIS